MKGSGMERIDWNDRAETYDGVFVMDPVYRDTLHAIAGELDPEGTPAVLDLGCGTGAVTSAVLERVPGARVRAVDPAPQMRQVSQRRFASDERVEVLPGTGTDLPAREGEFDFVVSNLAIHHIPRALKEACAGEVARVLKPGGKLVYGDHFTDVDAGPNDPSRARDMIEKTVAWALYALDHGAYEYMLGLLRVLPLCIGDEGEYLETPAKWRVLLEGAGFASFMAFDIHPAEFGVKVLVATRIQPLKKATLTRGP